MSDLDRRASTPRAAPALMHGHTKEAERVRAAIERGHTEGGRFIHRDTFWPAQACILAAIVLYFALPQKLTVGPTWLLPACEGLLLVGLVFSMPTARVRYSPRRRQLAIGLISLVSAANLASLFLLVHYLVRGGRTGGHQLILSGVVLWVTNVLVFALWYWELDRGGPVTRMVDENAHPDFLFPQMTDDVRNAPWGSKQWKPRFGDYLYVSFTNATAFSPTDTMPLSQPAKLVMMVQSLASLVTIGLVVARAVNILA